MENQRKTFLSYTRANKDFAIRLAKELKSEGFPIWLDTLDIPPGARWDVEVEKALVDCDIFMVIITQASSTSENVLDEIGYAIDTGKRLLPVLLEKSNIPLRLRRFQYVDFTDKNFDDGVQSAKDLLRNLIAQPTVPRRDLPDEAGNQLARTEGVKQESSTLREVLRPENLEHEQKLEEQSTRDRTPAVPTKTRSNRMVLLGLGILAGIVIMLGTFNLLPNRPDVERTSTQFIVASQNAEFAPEILFSPTSRTLSVTSSPLAVATNPLVTSTVSKTIWTTKARNVALRAGPHINHPGVSKNYDKGTPMDVLGTHNGWYFVIAPDGAKGWLYEEWINIDLADLTNMPLITIIPTAPLNTRIPPDRESEPGPGPQETLSNPYP